MREEERAAISLPDRLAHVFLVDNKMDSPTSAPSMLESNQSGSMKDAREDSTAHQKSEDGTDSRYPECISGCRSKTDSACAATSAVSTLTSDPLQEEKKNNQAIDLSLKFLNGLSKDTQSDASLMPGILCTEFNDFTHTGLLVSNISKKIKHNDSKLLPEVTMRPGAKIDEMLRESQARTFANRQLCNKTPSISTKPKEQLTPSPSTPPLQSKAFAEKIRNYDSCGQGLTFDNPGTEPSSSFQLNMRTPQGLSFDPDESLPSEEGEEHTLGDYEITVASSSEETLKQRPNSNHWSDSLLQPELDPCGILLAFDHMIDCLDHQDDDALNLSPQTLDTWTPDSLYDEAVLENDGIDRFLPCWKEEFNSLDFISFDESTLDEVSQLETFDSKGSFIGSEEESLSILEKFFDGLELEPSPAKYVPLDETMTTDEDSTLSYDLKLF
jgi:hypothetical protein